jgi:hypothetical protein
VRWSDFRWLELDAKKEFKRGRFVLYDHQRSALLLDPSDQQLAAVRTVRALA